MFNLRREKPPSCCLCLDVRTGSVLIGIWHLVGQLLGILLISYMVWRGGDNDIVENGKVIAIENQHNESDFTVGVVLILCYFVLTTLMIKGAIQYRSGLLLPFFCLQLFDFFITLLTSVHLMSYYPQYEYSDGTSDQYPNQEFMIWKENLSPTTVDIESRWFVFVALVMFLFIMTVKVYCIVCVWACYQHIVSLEVRGYHACSPDDPEFQFKDPTKPPCYDEALKDPMFKPPPPPYMDFH